MLKEDLLNEPLKYKEICRLMEDEEVEGGAGRKHQLEKWRQYYDIEKVGAKYIIKRQYDEKEIEFMKNKDNLSGYLANLLVDYLIENNEEIATMTYREIFEGLWMVNKRYYPVKYNNEEIEISMPRDYEQDAIKYNIDMFYSRSEAILKQLLTTAIEKLSDASLVTTQETFVLYKKVGATYIKKECSDDEIKKILGIQRDTMDICGFNDIKDIVIAPQYLKKKYGDIVKKRTQQELGCESFAKAFRFICVDNIEQRAQFNKIEFNKKIVIRMLESKRMNKVVNAAINEQLVDNLIKRV